MKDTIKMAFILFIFTAVCGGLLAGANWGTKDIIAERQEERLQAALALVFQEADEFILSDEKVVNGIIENDPNIINLYEANAGERLGSVVDVEVKGYGGPIKFVVGIDDKDQSVVGFNVLSLSETPGFGMAAVEDEFIEGTIGVKEGGEIDSITGATVTTGAIMQGIDSAIKARGILTGDYIERSPEEVRREAIAESYPEADDFNPVEDLIEVDDNVESICQAFSNDEIVGHAVVIMTPDGYGGDISFAIGVDKEGYITGFKSIIHGETPGFGAKMDEDEFNELIVGEKVANVATITGATVTSDALRDAIAKALEAVDILENGN